MEFSAKKNDLGKILAHVQSVVERKTAMPIIANVKVTANSNNTIGLLATDMDICIEDCIPAVVVQQAGCTTIPAWTLNEIIKKLPDNAEIKFKTNSDNLDTIQIQVGSSQFDLPTIKAEDFPSFEDPITTCNFEVQSKVMHELFTKTRHAISTEETRYYLNGIYLHTAKTSSGSEVLRAVATDGHRLSCAQTIQPNGAENMPGIIIPKKTVSELIKLLDSYAGNIEVSLSTNKIMFKIGSSIITSKLIEGNFPDYERVVPKNNDKVLKLTKKELANAIGLVTLIATDKTKAVKFNITDKKLLVSASSEMNGNARGEQIVGSEFNSTETITIGFNSKYVLDALAAIEGDDINLSFSNNLGAVIANEVNDDNFICILMPMQV